MRSKALLLSLVVASWLLFHHYDLADHVSFDALKLKHDELVRLFDRYPARFIITFMAINIVALTLALPGAVLAFALVAGIVFGMGAGTLVMLTSLTVGDTSGFLLARYLLRDWAADKFGHHLARFERGIEKDGALYLLSLRLIAAVPYFVVNLTMALTNMRVRTFAPVSFLGLIPSVLVYVNAGTQLGSLEHLGDALSPRVIASFALLGIMPLALRLTMRRTAVR